jgi:hypothetical protein
VQHVTSDWRRLILVQHKNARVADDVLVGQPIGGPQLVERWAAT